jgi:hypothetical protein
LFIALASTAPAASALAEPRARCVRGDCEYHFDDEDVNSPGPSPYGDVVKSRKGSPRVVLVRPRVSFVMELLKSVEGV